MSVKRADVNLNFEMKKNVSFYLICSMAVVSMFLCSGTGNAQINLQHTFDGGYVSFAGGYVYNNDAGCYYTSSSITNGQVKLYNADFSLYKTINVPNAQVVNCVTRNLFNSDRKIEFYVYTYNTNTGIFHSYLYNEDGTVIKDFGDGSSGGGVIKVNGQFKLFVNRLLNSTYTTDIYSLPGTVSAVPSQNVNEMQFPYPNPANSIITLPYQLKQGEISEMHIYNISGKLIETKHIDFVFDKILLNVSNYPKGEYIYEVNGVSNKFIVN